MTLARFERRLAPQSLLPMRFRAYPKQIRWHPSRCLRSADIVSRYGALLIDPSSKFEGAFDMILRH